MASLHPIPSKVVMQGKLNAVAYSLRTHGNQFSVGGICKQEYQIKSNQILFIYAEK